jgi:hypothetical protein
MRSSSFFWKVAWKIYEVAFTFSVGICIFWLFYPYEPIVIKTPFPVLNENKQVYAGGNIVYRIKSNKKMNLSCVLTRRINDLYSYPAIISRGENPVGEDDQAIFFPVPIYAAASNEATMSWSCTYRVNPLREVTVSGETEPFKIIAREPKSGMQGPKGEPGRNFWGK